MIVEIDYEFVNLETFIGNYKETKQLNCLKNTNLSDKWIQKNG